MIIDTIKLVNGEELRGYEENLEVPEKEGYIAMSSSEDLQIRYINTSNILYMCIDKERLECEREEDNAALVTVINEFGMVCE